MHIAVLAPPESWYTRDLQRAADSAGHKVTPLPFSRIHSLVATRPIATTSVASVEQDLAEFDAVLVRTMPPGSLEQVVFRMDALQRLEANGIRVVNPPKAIEVAVDKYLALAKLQAAGIEVPRTEVSQSIDEAMAGFQRLGGDVVLKPLFGSEGRGITRIADEAIAERTFKLLIQLGSVIYQQEFVEHEGYDIRIFVLGDQTYGMRRSSKLDWRTNASRGAKTEPLSLVGPDINQLQEIALRATEAVGAEISGVDLLPTVDGRLLTIEVNGVPGWRALKRTLDIDVADEILKWLSSSQ